MPAPNFQDHAAFRQFLRRVWRDDVAPLLRDQRAAQRRQAARTGGKLAAASGLAIDGLLGLKGKPFTRFLTVVGSSFGAMLPDVWEWKWFQTQTTPPERAAAADVIGRRAAELPEREALALFGLSPSATRAQLREAWREQARRWHPDRAPDGATRAEYHVRFVAHQAAYERLCAAYDAGRLPVPANPGHGT